MRASKLKPIGLILLLVLLCSSIEVSDARRIGKHWRQSLLMKKGKGKSAGNKRHSGNGASHSGYQSHPSAPPASPAPVNGTGKGGAKQKGAAPSPSANPGCGKGNLSPGIPPSLSPRQSPSISASPCPSPSPSPSPGEGKSFPPLLPPPPLLPRSGVFNVMEFGAKGDGVTDDTKAFEAAWAAACKVEASTVLVPADAQFLVGPISFSGPICAKNIVFQLEGQIIAPTSAKSWGPGLLQWLEFTKLRGTTIQGSGTIDGRGSVWWTGSDDDIDPMFGVELTEKMPDIKPTALRFYGSINVTVTGITIKNSPQCHLKFDSCEDVSVHNITISSPGDSVNTDGIHLQNSRDVNLHHTNIACGDDCVSIQTGSSNIYVHNLNCGPGHGISIGGLGRDNTKACVSNVTVRDINMQNTMAGVRIKTWQGGSGLVQNVRFSNIRVSQVQTPIMIDQFYCDRITCKNQTAAVAVSGVQYENIRGTFTVKPVHFACSDSLPCTDITLTGVELQPMPLQYHMYDPLCWQVFGELLTPTIPPIPCLQIGKPASNRILSDHDMC